MNMSSYSYRIVENGYFIDMDGVPYIKQLSPYDKPMDRSKTYAENAEMQIAELLANKNAEAENVSLDNDMAAMLVDLEYRTTLLELSADNAEV